MAAQFQLLTDQMRAQMTMVENPATPAPQVSPPESAPVSVLSLLEPRLGVPERYGGEPDG